MSSEKTLKEHIFQLRVQLEELDKKLKGLEELQIKRNKIQIALEIAKESLPSSILLDNQDPNITQDMLGWSFPDAVLKFLLEQQRPCTVEEIVDSVKARGVKSNSTSSGSTARSALYSLKRKNKVIQTSRNTWELKKETIEDSNEHEKL